VRSLLGSVVFLASLFMLRRILVETGLLTPTLALAFLACLVGIPLGGIVFLEGAIDTRTRELRREIEALRAELGANRRPSEPPER
jgi:archaellum biogenesis protein FlaJ (TadC family)